MAYRDSDVGLLLRLDPAKAHAKILSAFRATRGNTSKAAERLGVARATLKRWVAALEEQGFDTREQVEALRQAA